MNGPGAGPVLGVVAALEAEARTLGPAARRQDGLASLSDGALLAVSGMGCALAAAAARRLVDAGATALMSFGLAGGLDPDLRAGSIVLPDEIISLEGARFPTADAWREQLHLLIAKHHPVAGGKLLTSPQPIAAPAGKIAAFRETGAVAVDMESLAVAEVAAAHGLVFVCVRVIVDTAADALPRTILASSRDGRVDIGRPRCMKALVTGATGFVGAAVAKALSAAGWEVRVLVRRGSNRSNLQQLEAEVAEGDLADVAGLERALQGCAGLFHVAADYRLGARDPAPLYRTNVEGTRNILNAARTARVPRIVYTSSVATIGIPPDGSPGNEQTPASLANMIGHYKRSKYLAEEVVRDAARLGMSVVIVNPSTPVGPGDIKPTPTGQLILDAASGRMPAYVDTGLNIVHVDDVAAGHLLAFERGMAGERYILGGEDMTLQAILGQIARLVGRNPPRIRLPYAAVLPVAYLAEAFAKVSGRSGRITLEGVRMSRKRMFFSSGKAISELGYRWRPPLEAFEDAVRWFRVRGLLA